MGRSDYRRSALGVWLAVVLLAGCGGSQVGGSMPMGESVSQAKAHKMSGLSGNLLYVTIHGFIYAYTYPGYKQVLTFKSGLYLPDGASDPNNGNLCFASGGPVLVYAHGSTNPLARLSPPSGDETYDCAFDPTTDNLAITITDFTPGKCWIAVYTTLSGNPTMYSVPNMSYLRFVGYDGAGDLFVNGDGASSEVLDELPQGNSKFLALTLPRQIEELQSIRWDGTYITVRSNTTIYRLRFTGSTGTIVGSTMLTGAEQNNWGDAFTIEGDEVIGPHPEKHPGPYRPLGFWHYPDGDKPFKVIMVRRPDEGHFGIGTVAVSVAPSGSHIRK